MKGWAIFSLYTVGCTAWRSSLIRRHAASPVRASLDTLTLVETPTSLEPLLPSAAAQWHLDRRRAILAAHPTVRELVGTDRTTLPLLVAANCLQLAVAAGAKWMSW